MEIENVNPSRGTGSQHEAITVSNDDRASLWVFDDDEGEDFLRGKKGDYPPDFLDEEE